MAKRNGADKDTKKHLSNISDKRMMSEKIRLNKVTRIILISLAGLVIICGVILAVVLSSNNSKPNYSIKVDDLKDGKIIADCNAEISNLATSTCKPLTITGKVTLDEDSVLLFEKDFNPQIGVQIPVFDFSKLEALEKERTLKNAPFSLNKYINQDGTFSIKLDAEFISNNDPSNQEADNGLIIYNVKTEKVVSKLGLKVTYILSDSDKALMASQSVKLDEYNTANKTGDEKSNSNTVAISESKMKALCETRLKEKGVSNPTFVINYFADLEIDNEFIMMGTVKDGGAAKNVSCWYNSRLQAISYITIDGK